MDIKPRRIVIFIFLLVITQVGYANNNNLVFSWDMEKKIFRSPYKTSIERADGVIFDAFLYAPNEHMESEEYRFCNGVKKKIQSKTGNYYIYLYNLRTASFSPTRIEVFKNTKMRMNIQGAGIFTLYTDNPHKNKSDILFVSQSGCNGDYYEAYSFPGNEPSLVQYTFVDEEKYKRFHGTIITNNKFIKKLLVYRNNGNNVMQKMYLILANIPGIIPLKSAS